MSDKIYLVQGDTGPQIRITLTDDLTGLPTDLTGAEVNLHFREGETGTYLFTCKAYINPDTASQGVAIFRWQAGDLDREGGYYEGEIEVVYNYGLRQTIYETLKFIIREDFA